MCHAGTTIMGQYRETFETQATHKAKLIGSHRALGISEAIRRSEWLTAVAIATQVSRYDGEVPTQHRRHTMPDRMGLGMTVQQQQPRPMSSNMTGDGNAVGFDQSWGEMLEHG
ncbi:hypothetical protein GCM10010872_33000 [Dyella flava]|nr:hypothetical protein GCM10010872_33000 [Dyella flava]